MRTRRASLDASKTTVKRSAGVSIPSQPLLLMGQTPDTVFDNDDGAIHDETEIKRAQTHQVGADMVGHHAAEGKQHRERDNKRGNERCPQIAEEQEQHHNDQGSAFKQIGRDRSNGFIDQDGAVIDRGRNHAFRQVAIDLRQFFGDRVGDGAAVFADQHKRRAQHHLFAILRSGASAQFLAYNDIGNIFDAYGHSLTAEPRIILPISSRFITCPGNRTRYCSPLFSI